MPHGFDPLRRRLLAGLAAAPVLASVTSACGRRGQPERFFEDEGVVELIAAAEKGDGARAAQLVADGVDPNALGNDEDPRRVALTPLHYSVEFSPLRAIGVLLDVGADPLRPHAPDGGPKAGENVPHYAARRDLAEPLRELVSLRPSVVEAPARTGGNLLHSVAGSINLEDRSDADDSLLRQAIDAGADLDSRQTVSGWTPLFSAAAVHNWRACLVLIRAGADAGLRDAQGNRWLGMIMKHDDSMLTAEFRDGRREVVRELEARGFPTEY